MKVKVRFYGINSDGKMVHIAIGLSCTYENSLVDRFLELTKYQEYVFYGTVFEENSFLGLVYINFINGYDKPGSCGNLNVKSKKEWDKIWEEEYKDLGITENQLKEILYHVYIDCTASEMK